MPSTLYTKGTIKIKNMNGEMDKFYPNTRTDCVTDASGNVLSTMLQNFDTRIQSVESTGGIKVVTSEPTAQNTSGYAEDTLIAWLEDEEQGG